MRYSKKKSITLGPGYQYLSLYGQYTGGGALVCGGSIISEDYVLTTGHCLAKVGNFWVKVRTGDYNSRFVEGSFEQVDRVALSDL